MSEATIQRPTSVKSIFLLTMFKIVLAWVLYGVISYKGNNPALANMILMTASAYVLLAIPTFVFIHKHNAWGVRICVGLAVVASIPVKAVIGIAIDLIAFGLTYRQAAKEFFYASAKA